MKKRVLCMAACILLILIAILLFLLFSRDKRTFLYVNSDEVFYNPLMGFAVNADYYDAVGDNTLVYVDITWREWEPVEGSFAVEEVKRDNFWDEWSSLGKHVVLRFVCDEPSDEKHMDIPDWLYEKTGDGSFYDHDYGMGYTPEYNNKDFIEAHDRAVKALGEAFGQDNMVAYIELGSLGHWGEWHMLYTKGTTRIPGKEVRALYTAPYLEAFPNALLLARRPFSETAQIGAGLYNDMTGDSKSTMKWLAWIDSGGVYSQPEEEEQLVPQPEIWRTAPIGGEFTSGISYDKMLESGLKETIELLELSHTTFIGPKCPVVEETDTYERGVSKILKTIGYRYGVTECSINGWKWQKERSITLNLVNRGIAPIYFPWKMVLYVYDGNGVKIDRIEVPVDLMKLCGGESIAVTVKGVPYRDNYQYGVAVEDPDTGKPAVYLDMRQQKNDIQEKLVYML